MTRIELADRFAENAHRGQVRKYTGEPYIVHPRAVAATVQQVLCNDEDAVIAALLHDVVEDTPVTLDMIDMAFGSRVAEMVWFLTEERPEGLNRNARKRAYAKKLALAPFTVETIKLADLLDNTKDITLHDPQFAPVYMAEKTFMLGALTGGNLELYNQAHEQCMRYFKGRKREDDRNAGLRNVP